MMDTKGETLHQDECSRNAHHWVIDGKNLGVCKKCGAQKQFLVDVFGWQRIAKQSLRSIKHGHGGRAVRKKEESASGSK
jgi:hypothetical protein